MHWVTLCVFRFANSFSVDEPPITIVVGSSEQRFHVHSSVFQTSSEFFNAALKEHWCEGKQHEVKLSEDSPVTFKFYANWLYTGKVNTTVWSQLAELYGLGEKIIDTAFQNDVINILVALSRKADARNRSELPGQADVGIIYRNTPVGSPARRLMLDFYAIYGTSE